MKLNNFSGTEDKKILSVAELTFSIKKILETNQDLNDIWVKGELSNFTKHGSGHLYFSIKDEHSQLSCVMFRRAAGNKKCLNFEPKHGDKVIVKGSITVYEVRGSYQLLVTEMKKDGLGELHKKFLELKEKLGKEGLFDQKRLIPSFPKVIGIVSSPTSAALQDILNTIRRRFPCVKAIIAPAIVQGEAGTSSIVKAINALNRLNEEHHQKIDTIIIARGGGSLEDLWCFNEEPVARAIYNSKIPIISGVGHETDFTITDFVADLRAPTPTAAAEQAVPVRDDWIYTLKDYQKTFTRHLENFVGNRQQQLDHLITQLLAEMKLLLQAKKEKLNILQSKLQGLNVDATLRRGFSVTMKNGKVVKNVNVLNEGDDLKTILAEGEFISKLLNKTEEKNK
ncbi:MAG: exodeoxyribonuclease VII large subunit [archaeon]|nr:exodeoxyribonuclease VII large subunit [Nanoarchaeota archaeon]